MNLFGLSITRRQKALSAADQAMVTTVPAGSIGWFGGGWWPIVREAFAGAWQTNQEIRIENVTAHWAVFACISLISTDIGKMRLKLIAQNPNGIWEETTNPAFSPVIRKPNHYQIRQRFYEWWMTSKLEHGNTYVLKRRDQRNVVDALYVLDPCRTRPLVAPDGSVFYQLNTDNLSGLESAVVVPASEIIHDIYIALFHPLCGVPPLYACGLAALQGLKIAHSSTNFFANGAQPGGLLLAPGRITEPQAKTLKETWEANFTGQNAGRVAVLGDGLKYEPMITKAVDAQLIDQLKWTAEAVCTAYRVPPHKIAVGQMPNYNNIEALDQQYYSNCLQEKIEAIEALLNEGLELPKDNTGRQLATEFELDDLLRMDSATLIKAEKEASGIKKVNESRRRLNLPPIEGGDTVYLQQQDYSIEALNRRDQEAPAPSSQTPPASATPAPDPQASNAEKAARVLQFDAELRRRLAS